MTDRITSVTVGKQGPPGPPSITTTTASFVQPAVNASVSVSVKNTTWMAASGMPIYVQGGGSYTVTTTPAPGAIVVALTNLGGSSNATPGTTIALGALVVPSGAQGPAGTAGTPPTGTGFLHITSGAFDASARAVNLASSDVTGTLPSGNQAAQSLAGAVGGTTAASTIGLTGNASITGVLPAANQAAQSMAGAVGGTTAASTISLTANASITGVLPAANQAAQALGGALGGTTAAGTVNLAAGASVTGVLPSANQAAQTLGGALTGTTAAAVVAAVAPAAITGGADGQYVGHVSGSAAWVTPDTLTLTPTSTSADVFTINLPALYAGKLVNFKNSAGNSEAVISDAVGLKTSLYTSDATNGSYIGLGTNATAGYAASGATLGGLDFIANGAAPNSSGAGIFGIAIENQGVAALGTDLALQVIPAGTTAAVKAIRLYSNGDVSANPTGSALATGATGGFFYLPNMAGQPTGTPTGRTGATPFVWDTTNGRLWQVNSGSASVDVGGLTVTASGPSNGTTLQPGSFNRVGSGQSGFGYVLPDPTKCKGSRVTVKCTSAGGNYSFALTSAGSGPPNIDGASSYTLTSNFELAEVSFDSDGTGWQSNAAHVVVTRATGALPLANVAQGGATTNQVMQWNGSTWAPVAPPYTVDSPANHSFLEWSGIPFYVASTANVGNRVYLSKFTAQTGGAIGHIFVSVTTASTTPTAATTATISNVTNNGSGFCRITATAHGFTTGDVVYNTGIVGATEANTVDVITVIDVNTFDMNTTAFTSAYTSGGTATRSANCAALYSSSGAFLGATVDQASAFSAGTSAALSMALVSPVTLAVNTVYYMAVMSNQSGTSLAVRTGSNNNVAFANANISGGANLLVGTIGGAVTKLPGSFTPSSVVTTSGVTYWWALAA